MKDEAWAKGLFILILVIVAIAVAVVAWQYVVALAPKPFVPIQLPTLGGI